MYSDQKNCSSSDQLKQVSIIILKKNLKQNINVIIKYYNLNYLCQPIPALLHSSPDFSLPPETSLDVKKTVQNERKLYRYDVLYLIYIK